MGEKRVPAPALYWAITIWIVAIVGIAFVVGPVAAIRSLAISMVGLALLRLILPTGAVPDIRGRVWDTLTLVTCGLALLGLADWGNATYVA